MPFPDPPKGDPTAIAACARRLGSAAEDMEGAETGLRGAQGSLEFDWQGYAARAYDAASTALGAVARGAGATFHECATAISRYGADLDHVQSELRRLKHLYDQALIREETAHGLAGRLQTEIASATKKPEISRLSTQIGNAQHEAQGAVDDANGYARHAQALVNEFNGKARGYAATLTGQRDTLGGRCPGLGAPGRSFGIPSSGFPGVDPHGLDPYRGIIPVGDPWNSPIPGYSTYLDSMSNATSPDDVTNLITVLAGGPYGGALKDLGVDALKVIADKVGIGAAGREAAQQAGRDAAQKVIYSGDHSMGAAKARQIRQAGNRATATAQAGQEATRNRLIVQGLDILNKTGRIPSGVKDGVEHFLPMKPYYKAQVIRGVQAMIRWLSR